MRHHIEYEKGWISALIDGEGSLSLLKVSRPLFRDHYTWVPRLSIANTCRKLLDCAKEIIGSGHIYLKKGKTYRSPFYQFECTSGTLRGFLPRIELIAKEKQRLLLIEAMDLLKNRKYGLKGDCGSKRLQEIYAEIRRLNSWRGNKIATLERQ